MSNFKLRRVCSRVLRPGTKMQAMSFKLTCKSHHYYRIGVQFTSLNHYGTLKVK
jgi:hypothetical protein